MANLTLSQFVDKWTTQKFTSGNYDKIDDSYLREFVEDIRDTFGVEAVNVSVYDPTKTYAVGDLVRYTPNSGLEAFYYALNPGQLAAPGGNFTEWKVVPGPTTATALSQAISLVQAQGIEGDAVVAGRTYLIDFGPDAQNNGQTVSLVGVSNNSFAKSGTLEINGQRWDVENVDVFAGTYALCYSRSKLDQLLATKQGAITQTRPTFIPPGTAGLTRAAFGTYLEASTAGKSLVDLPPPTLAEVGTLLAVYNAGGSGGGGTLSWQVTLPPGNPSPGFPVNSGPTALDATTPPKFVTLFEVVNYRRGFPYSDTVASYVALATSQVLDAEEPAVVVARLLGEHFRTAIYTVQAADLPAPVITVADAALISSVRMGPAGGAKKLLTYGTDYTTSGNVLTILAAAHAATDYQVVYAYVPGSVQAGGGVTAAQLETVRTTVGLSAAVSTNYTLGAADAGNIVPVTAAVNITVPLHSAVPLPVGAVLELVATTPALFTVLAASGVTVLAATGNVAAGQGIPVRLVQLAIDSWLLTGGSV